MDNLNLNVSKAVISARISFHQNVQNPFLKKTKKLSLTPFECQSLSSVRVFSNLLLDQPNRGPKQTETKLRIEEKH